MSRPAWLDLLSYFVYHYFNVDVKDVKVSSKEMFIGELAERAGVTPRTVRYYEERGLMGPGYREGSGFRRYDEDNLSRLWLIDRLKTLGLSLEEIGAVLPLYYEDPSGIRGKREVLGILEGHLKETEAKVAALEGFRFELQQSIERMRKYVEEAESNSK